MSYIWNNYSWENKFKVSFYEISPYLEVFSRTDNFVYVNIFYRIYELLMPKAVLYNEELINKQLERYTDNERFSDIANLLMHFIAQTDQLKGIRLQEIMERISRKEIGQGRYGDDTKERFNSLQERDKDIILRYLAKYNLGSQRETVFDGVLNALFSKVRLYYEHSTEIIYVYIEEDNHEYNIKLYKLCEYFFKDFGIKTEVMWKQEHFGVIGIEDSMIIDEITLR